ncbi:hypothetical protein [Ruegeria atlantica]|uniref:Uncharacterized protein n=1 Tax=Ruegeria atlantica TaxID=81569 RepID=A0A0P1E9Y6_9RHOB|nr:hypothetical protein [Ruegeria atlantica]CUH45378.1 hypothetical protein RUM4293_04291 [Ruegeria atlantica]
MSRSSLNMAGFILVGIALTTAAVSLAFFVSPEAVRSPPPDTYNSLLLEMFANR